MSKCHIFGWCILPPFISDWRKWFQIWVSEYTSTSWSPEKPILEKYWYKRLDTFIQACILTECRVEEKQKRKRTLVILPFFSEFIFYHPTHLYYVFKFSHIQLFVTPLDCSLPESSVHGIFQARILEKVAIRFSRASSQPRDWTHVCCIFCASSWII